MKTKENSTHKRYKQYVVADAGYCTKKNNLFLLKKGYIPVIAYNKRNCKNKQKIKQNKLSGKKIIYKKRRIIESFFGWIKKIPIINQNYQKQFHLTMAYYHYYLQFLFQTKFKHLKWTGEIFNFSLYIIFCTIKKLFKKSEMLTIN